MIDSFFMVVAKRQDFFAPKRRLILCCSASKALPATILSRCDVTQKYLYYKARGLCDPIAVVTVTFLTRETPKSVA